MNKERDDAIVTAVLNGETVIVAAKANSITPERVRQILARFCRSTNKELFGRMKRENGGHPNLAWARTHRTEFLNE